MYRIPSSLNLDAIIGYDLNLLGLGRYDIQLNFIGSGVKICVQGNVTLRKNGKIIATWNDTDNWSSLSFQKLLNANVIKYSIPHDRLLEIEFFQDLVLQLHDDSDQYEAMQIYFDDRNKPTIII